MYLTRLSLTNFRNYTRLELSLPYQVVILQGDNAQGKSNFLEAIYYLVTTRSPHTSTNRQLINWMADEEVLPYARLEGRVQRHDSPCRVTMTLMKKPVGNRGKFQLRRQIELNGVRKTAAEFLGELLVVLFSPQDIDLVDGSPGSRRRFLNILLCLLDKQYCRALRRYKATLRQRNSLLSHLSQGRGNCEELEVWDEQLTASGAYLIAQRWQAVDGLDRLGQTFHRKLTNGQERLRLSYEPSLDPTQSSSLNYQLPLDFTELQNRRGAWSKLDSSAIAAAFRARLRELRSDEIERGMTLIGPQRDDVHFLVNGVDMTIYGSRGQQRTVALSLRLAERAFMLEERGEEPVLLLDDIMSELDQMRRAALMELLDDTEQVILTTTDWKDYRPDFLAHVHCLSVEAGQIKPADPALAE
ncbi:MAG: DNA replication/repair protein RecF [Chloroflexota bacterium]|nr:DNA replication/repair protein RecF [Chloroflexota bacterium]